MPKRRYAGYRSAAPPDNEIPLWLWSCILSLSIRFETKSTKI
jgi:hypothetical protein